MDGAKHTCSRHSFCVSLHPPLDQSSSSASALGKLKMPCHENPDLEKCRRGKKRHPLGLASAALLRVWVALLVSSS